MAYFWKQTSGRTTELGQELDGERWEQYPESVTPEQLSVPVAEPNVRGRVR